MGMVFDRYRGALVLYSAEETWELRGTTWQELTPASSPPVTDRFAFAYDPVRYRGVLWGGGEALTWEWNGAVAEVR